MKRFVKLIPILALLCLPMSCELTEEQQAAYDKIEQELRDAKDSRILTHNSDLYDLHFEEFTFRGHDIWYFRQGSGDNAVGSFMHSPECQKCNGSILPTKPSQKKEVPEEELSEYEKIFGRSY